MGIGLYRNCTVYEPSKEVTAPNPDPAKYHISFMQQVGKNLVAKVIYPNCTNMEGTKILVFLNTSIKQLESHTSLDPHFQEDQELSPFARLYPNELGWQAAVNLAGSIEIKK